MIRSENEKFLRIFVIFINTQQKILMKINEIFEKIGVLNGALLKDYKNLTQAQIDKLAEEIDKLIGGLKKEKLNSDGSDSNHPVLITAAQAAKHLGVTRQTIYNHVKNGTLKSRGIKGDHRFRYDDLDQFQLVLTRPRALCTTNTICYDKRTDDIAVFRKDMIYKIMRENKTYVYLFNEKWEGAIRMSIKQFRKNFSAEGEIEFDVRKYNI